MEARTNASRPFFRLQLWNLSGNLLLPRDGKLLFSLTVSLLFMHRSSLDRLSSPPSCFSFIEDVYTSAAHVLELVHLHIEESAGVTCAWDNYYYPGSFWHRPRQ